MVISIKSRNWGSSRRRSFSRKNTSILSGSPCIITVGSPSTLIFRSEITETRLSGCSVDPITQSPRIGLVMVIRSYFSSSYHFMLFDNWLLCQTFPLGSVNRVDCSELFLNSKMVASSTLESIWKTLPIMGNWSWGAAWSRTWRNVPINCSASAATVETPPVANAILFSRLWSACSESAIVWIFTPASRYFLTNSHLIFFRDCAFFLSSFEISTWPSVRRIKWLLFCVFPSTRS